MKKLKLLLFIVVSIFTLTACSKVENEVVNLVKSIDGSYSTTISGVGVDIKVDGEEVTGKAVIGFVSKNISGTVDLKKERIDLDITENISISGEYEVVDGDLEVEFSGQTVVFERN